MKLQRAPYGLLSFLDLKAEGQNPDAFSSILQGGVDLTDFYGATQLEVVSVPLAAQAGPTVVIRQTVPQGEFWRVRAVSAEISAAATTAFTDKMISMSVGVENPTQSGVKIGSALYTVTSPLTAAMRFELGVPMIPCAILAPGWSVQAALFYNSTVLNPDTSLSVFFERYRA